MRIAFFGTPANSARVLQSVIDAGHEVALVVTQPDKRRGRGSATSMSAVKEVALEHGIDVTHRVEDVLDVDVELGVLVSFGRIIKSDVLRHVTILNLHPSLLPRWRGATPVEAAIMAGDQTTGIAVMELVEAMDAGPVHAMVETAIRPDEDAGQLYGRLFAIGTELLLEQLQYGLTEPVPQQGEPTYCGRLTPEDFHIDWTDPAGEIQRLTRVGRAWTTFRGRRFFVVAADVLEDRRPGPEEGSQDDRGDRSRRRPGSIDGIDVVTGDGVLRLLKVQAEGKGPQDARSWERGARLESDDWFE